MLKILEAKPQDMLPICPTEIKRRNKNNEYYITGQLNCIIMPQPLQLEVHFFSLGLYEVFWFFNESSYYVFSML